MKAVDVLGGVDCFEDFLCVHLRWQRELDEDAIDVVAMIQALDDGEEFRRGNAGGRSEMDTGEAQLFTRCDFAFYVDSRGGIFAYEDRGESRANSCGGERGDLVREFGVDFFADRVTVEDARGQKGSLGCVAPS